MISDALELFPNVETTAQQVGGCLRRLVLSCGGEKFDGAWREVSELRPAGRSEIGWMLQEHYLKCWPGVVMAQLTITVGGIPCGCIVYALPPRETMKRYGGMTWELARLWVHDSVPRNVETWIIGKSIRWIKKNHPEVVCLVSYADPAFGHGGTIYKASNWKADGRTDGERKSPRIDYKDAVTGQTYSRRSHVPATATIERVPRSSKWRFVMPLHRQNVTVEGPAESATPQIEKGN